MSEQSNKAEENKQTKETAKTETAGKAEENNWQEQLATAIGGENKWVVNAIKSITNPLVMTAGGIGIVYWYFKNKEQKEAIEALKEENKQLKERLKSMEDEFNGMKKKYKELQPEFFEGQEKDKALGTLSGNKSLSYPKRKYHSAFLD